MTHDPGSRAPGAVQSRIADLFGRRSVWAAIIVTVVALPLLRAFTADVPAAPAPVYADSLPPFRLVDHRGEPFGSDELRGKTWVASFIFTRCVTVCPEITRVMSKVQHRIRNVKHEARLVSITVDPQHDTPKQLLAYAERSRALAAGNWSFLTGGLEELRALVFGGFKMPFGSKPEPGEGEHEHAGHEPTGPDAAAELLDVAHLAHGRKLVLVDPDLRIRGYYDPDDDGVDRLVRDLGLVVNHVPEAPPVLRTSRPAAPAGR